MRALAVSPAGVEVIDVPEPKPSRTSVIVEVRACGICGSDVHLAGSAQFKGQILGHEFSGTVVTVGDEVHGVELGQHVAVNPLGHCGVCAACRRGLSFMCKAAPNIGISAQGAFAELISVPANQLHIFDNAIDLEVGSHAEPLAVALAAIRAAEITPGDDALVVGVGTIGLFMIAGLRAMGARRIVAVGRAPGRRRVAAEFGADIVLDARAADLLGQLQHLNIEFAAAFECSGAPDMMLVVAPVMGIGATIVEVALPPEPGQVNLRTLVDKALRIAGSCAFSPPDYERALDLLLRGVVDADPIVSERVSLSDAPDAFERLRDPGELVGVLVEPWR